MITLEEAYEIVKKSVNYLGTEKISISHSINRILAEDVKSDIEMPPFDKSAMDGYACRREDLSSELRVIEVIAAGQTPGKEITIGTCAKIMTGAPIPKGADCVLMVEDSKEIGDNKIIATKEYHRSNIRYKGEDVKKGQHVLDKGIIIKPQHVAVMASVGCAEPLVAKQPVVGVISTGDELVEPNQMPSISQIRNSNGHQLVTQVLASGAIPNYYGIAEDTEEVTYNMIINALSKNDIVLLTGGVSMGDYDFVPKVMKRAGVEILFDRVAVKPGKPTTFGIAGKKFIFGLPGNPVSSFVQFELFVKPLIYSMMGSDYVPPYVVLPMGKDYSHKKSNRKSFYPVYIDDKGEVFLVEYHGSAHIHALVKADGLIAMPIGKSSLKKGEKVHVRQI